MMRRRHLGLSLFVTVLALPSQALAAWGDDWGTMVWEATPVGVPTFGLFGLGLLSLALVAGAVFTLRKRAWTASVLLVAELGRHPADTLARRQREAGKRVPDLADVYFGRQYEVLTERSKIKRRTMERRKKEYLAQKAA